MMLDLEEVQVRKMVLGWKNQMKIVKEEIICKNN